MPAQPTRAQREAQYADATRQFAIGFSQRQAEQAALAKRVLSAQIAGFVVGGLIGRSFGRRR